MHDSIRLSASIFKTLPAGTLSAAAFKDIGVTGVVDATDRILYDSQAGALYYDPDGSASAAAVQCATLTGDPTLSAVDFTVAAAPKPRSLATRSMKAPHLRSARVPLYCEPT
jgi:hypothetical protein